MICQANKAGRSIPPSQIIFVVNVTTNLRGAARSHAAALPRAGGRARVLVRWPTPPRAVNLLWNTRADVDVSAGVSAGTGVSA
jgi:hypothetical protein